MLILRIMAAMLLHRRWRREARGRDSFPHSLPRAQSNFEIRQRNETDTDTDDASSEPQEGADRLSTVQSAQGQGKPNLNDASCTNRKSAVYHQHMEDSNLTVAWDALSRLPKHPQTPTDKRQPHCHAVYNRDVPLRLRDISIDRRRALFL